MEYLTYLIFYWLPLEYVRYTSFLKMAMYFFLKNDLRTNSLFSKHSKKLAKTVVYPDQSKQSISLSERMKNHWDSFDWIILQKQNIDVKKLQK